VRKAHCQAVTLGPVIIPRPGTRIGAANLLPALAVIRLTACYGFSEPATGRLSCAGLLQPR
jgi:hypothetical protein